ncbi:hypothetical protein HU200_063845 [Digitaria exilis]|uniref:FAS1 domain-containing protein n=1 Tax=Digitaria exilis TaxID=1010633 RepID=A0A835A2U1_9POAL|nr:hypothetical protein HU200_063845 [Digitaria exilis]
MRLAAAASILLLLLILGASPSCHGGAPNHNITAILAAHPDFTEFSAALSSTGAAAEIDRRGTITVLAVDNAVMARLKAQKLDPKDLSRVVYLHVLLDYFDSVKLPTIQGGFALATSLFQASGRAQSSEGMVNITVLPGGRVAFAPSGASNNALPAAFYQKPIHEAPYDIAVLQVSSVIWSPAPLAVAPAPAPPPPDAAAPAPDTAPAGHRESPPPASSAPASLPAHEPTSPPVVAPVATPPTPRRHPAPPSEDTSPAASPDSDDDSQPPADQKNNGARNAASWTVGTAVAAAVLALVLLM